MSEFTPDPDEPISVVSFPELAEDALQGTAGKIVRGIAPYTEAHPAAMLAHLLAEFGCRAGPDPHLFADNREHPARLYPLILGKTSTGAKGTASNAVSPLFASMPPEDSGGFKISRSPLTIVSGISSGEGLIEAVRDGADDDPGVADKRLLIVEPEFVSTLAVMERQNSIAPRVVRQAWDGDDLRTMTRKPLVATRPHITMIVHATPGELKPKISQAHLLGGTMNRYLPTASRRTRLLSGGGNLPDATRDEFAVVLGEALTASGEIRRMKRTPAADRLWDESYPHLRRDRPDGPVASMLARAAPNVLRLSVAYALLDSSERIDDEHVRAALAFWSYVEDSAEWLFGAKIDTQGLNDLVDFIASAGPAGCMQNQIREGFYKKNRAADDVRATLGELIKDGRIRQQTDEPSGPGRPATRYFPC